MDDKLLAVINRIRAHKGLAPLSALDPAARLRQDLDLDSFDLAELTVHLEEASGIDVFAEGLVRTVGEVRRRLPP